MTPADKLSVKVTVTNTGNYDGEETVQLYIRDMVASVTQPVKELKISKSFSAKRREPRNFICTRRG